MNIQTEDRIVWNVNRSPHKRGGHRTVPSQADREYLRLEATSQARQALRCIPSYFDAVGFETA